MRRAIQISVMAAIVLLAATLGWSVTPPECLALRKHGHRPEARKCFESLTLTHDPYLRAEGYWGLDQYEEANSEFRTAVAQ